MIVVAVHVESIERFYQFVDNAYFMFAMGLIHTFSAEQSVQKAGAFQANVLYFLIVVGFSMDADPDIILVVVVHRAEANL